MHMPWQSFLAEIQERGEFPGPEAAERAARVVLDLLGAHLVGQVRADLAARLPETEARILLNPLEAREPLTPERFVRAAAAWLDSPSEKIAARDVSAVLSVIADVAGEQLMPAILQQLPDGYDQLFGRLQLT